MLPALPLRSNTIFVGQPVDETTNDFYNSQYKTTGTNGVV